MEKGRNMDKIARSELNNKKMDKLIEKQDRIIGLAKDIKAIGMCYIKNRDIARQVQKVDQQIKVAYDKGERMYIATYVEKLEGRVRTAKRGNIVETRKQGKAMDKWLSEFYEGREKNGKIPKKS